MWIDEKPKNEKRKTTQRPWWVWGMIGLAVIGVCIAIAQSFDLLPDRSDFQATQTAAQSTRTSLDDLRSASTARAPVATSTRVFVLPTFVIPDRKPRPTSQIAEIVPTVAYRLLMPREIKGNSTIPLQKK